MRYSYEYKKHCVELYHQGKWPSTPPGITTKRFRQSVRIWVRVAQAQGIYALQHKPQNKRWTIEEKLALITKVLAGNSVKTIACDAGIHSGMLYTWVRKYKILGYNSLISKKKGRPVKYNAMKKRNIPQPRKLTESEYEELLRLREENAYIKAENAVIKKEIALREQKQAAQLKAKKQRLSKRYEPKDMP